MSLDRGGFSPRPSVWSISWISTVASSSGFPLMIPAKAVGQTKTTRLCGAVTARALLRHAGRSYPSEKTIHLRYPCADTPFSSSTSFSVRPEASRKSVRTS